MIPEFLELITIPSLLNIDAYKNIAKKCLLKIQTNGDEEWCANNFPLYSIPGPRKASLRQVKIQRITSTAYQE